MNWLKYDGVVAKKGGRTIIQEFESEVKEGLHDIHGNSMGYTYGIIQYSQNVYCHQYQEANLL